MERDLKNKLRLEFIEIQQRYPFMNFVTPNFETENVRELTNQIHSFRCRAYKYFIDEKRKSNPTYLELRTFISDISNRNFREEYLNEFILNYSIGNPFKMYLLEKIIFENATKERIINFLNNMLNGHRNLNELFPFEHIHKSLNCNFSQIATAMNKLNELIENDSTITEFQLLIINSHINKNFIFNIIQLSLVEFPEIETKDELIGKIIEKLDKI